MTVALQVAGRTTLGRKWLVLRSAQDDVEERVDGLMVV
jgi:hypothetical protein